jgi:hypothetical protein
MEDNEKIAVGFAASGSVYADFAKSVMQLLIHCPGKIKDVISSNGPYIVENRNRVVEEFLKTEMDWLLFFDTDIVTTIKDFNTLVKAADKEKYPVIGGKYFLPLGGMIRVSGQHLVPDSKLRDPGSWIENWQPNEILDNLHSMGMGYVLIHRTVFEKIAEINTKTPHPWFLVEYRPKPWRGWISEDIWFYEEVRKAGFNIALHTGVTSTHLGKLPVIEEDFLTQRGLKGGRGV